MTSSSDSVIWVGYSWQLTAGKSALCVAVSKSEVGEEGDTKQDREVLSFPLIWDSRAKPVPLPEPGMVSALGISGLGGFHPEAQSILGPAGGDWVEQVKLIDQRFERILADLLMGIVNGIARREEPFDGWLPGVAGKRASASSVHIVIQGPSFPKLLGRLAYRRLSMANEQLTVSFLTFRRSFLTPNPLLLSELTTPEQSGRNVLLHGPVPSVHDEAIVRRYYILPRPVSPLEEDKRSSGQQPDFPGLRGQYPLLMEAFCQGLVGQEALVSRVDRVLQSIGFSSGTTPDGEWVAEWGRWQQHPREEALRRVWVPKHMMEVNAASLAGLRELIGEKPESVADPTIIPFANIKRVLDVAQESELSIGEFVKQMVAKPRAFPGGEAGDRVSEFLEYVRKHPTEATASAESIVGHGGDE